MYFRGGKMMLRTTTILAAGAVSFALTVPVAANAANSVNPAGPIGGSDIRSGLLPPPGFYIQGIGVVTPPAAVFNDDGSRNDDAKGKQILGGFAALYVYDEEILGGHAATSLFVPYKRYCFGFTSATQECNTGIGDLYSDVFQWSRFFPSEDFATQDKSAPPIPFGLGVAVGLGLGIPTGQYDASTFANVGSNKWAFSPNLALTYTTKSIFGPSFGDATEFSARIFYTKYSTNTDIDYRDGDLVNVDFAVSQRFGQLQAGLYGSYVNQITDDEQGGIAVPGGRRAKGFGLGPVLSYDFMMNDRPWNLTLKSVTYFDGQNFGGNTSILVKLGMKLF
jgi:hypothetical protein